MAESGGDSGGQKFCTDCGASLTSDAKFCSECGAETNLGVTEEPKEHPQTEAQQSEEDTSTKSFSENLRTVGIIFAYIWGVILLIFALGSYSLNANIIGVLISGIIGLLFLPVVREALGIGNLPGIEKTNSDRRNVLTGIGYGVASFFAVGAMTSDVGGSGSVDEPGAGADEPTATEGGSDGGQVDATPTNQQYPDAYAYDRDLGIVLRDVEGSVGQYSSEVTGVAENTSETSYDYVSLQFGLYDSTDAKVGDALANTSGLAAGQRWRFEAFSSQTENVERYALEDITAY